MLCPCGFASLYNIFDYFAAHDTATLANEMFCIINTNVTAGIDDTLTPDKVLSGVLQYIVIPVA